MVIGPDVLDLAGYPMDQDRDYVPGETPGDRYTASFTMTAPRVYWHSPSLETQAPVDSIRFDFGGDMDESSFSIADDIVSFTGPGGPITPTGYSWPDPYTLEVTFDPQTTLGPYEMVIGPDILDLAGNAMDQDRDFVVGRDPRRPLHRLLHHDRPQGVRAFTLTGNPSARRLHPLRLRRRHGREQLLHRRRHR